MQREIQRENEFQDFLWHIETNWQWRGDTGDLVTEILAREFNLPMTVLAPGYAYDVGPSNQPPIGYLMYDGNHYMAGWSAVAPRSAAALYQNAVYRGNAAPSTATARTTDATANEVDAFVKGFNVLSTEVYQALLKNVPAGQVQGLDLANRAQLIINAFNDAQPPPGVQMEAAEFSVLTLYYQQLGDLLQQMADVAPSSTTTASSPSPQTTSASAVSPLATPTPPTVSAPTAPWSHQLPNGVRLELWTELPAERPHPSRRWSRQPGPDGHPRPHRRGRWDDPNSWRHLDEEPDHQRAKKARD